MIVNIKKTRIKPVEEIPKQEGFQFISFKKDGSFFLNKVFKGSTGSLLFSRFRDVVGWLPIQIEDANQQSFNQTLAHPEEQGRRKSNRAEV